VSKTNSRQAIEELESYVRRDLNKVAQRRMAVLRPIKLTLTNWPEGQVEYFELMNNPENPDDGTRKVAFTGELFIESEDFAEVPPPKFFRLSLGREVRLRGAYFVTATDLVTDDQGNVVEVLATYDPASKGGNSPDGRKVKSTIHWVCRPYAVPVNVALYDRLFTTTVPGDATGEPLDDLNPDSRELLNVCLAEAALAETEPGEVVQFERLGYFAADPQQELFFHRTVGLRDEWAAIQKRQR
ncbi:MAG: glutamine--tRNA ligase, partial [Propionibacterium sp.]|nr:glutamine--tRNA ligase [Propionibacterium sp.]